MRRIFSLIIVYALSTFLAHGGEWDEFSPRIDDTVSQVLSGSPLSKAEKDKWFDDISIHMSKVYEKYDLSETSPLSKFSDELVIDHYIFSLKMSVISPKLFGGWPFGHGDLKRVHRIFKTNVSDKSDPVEMSAAILSATRLNDIEFARKYYRKLINKDKDWANYVT